MILSYLNKYSCNLSIVILTILILFSVSGKDISYADKNQFDENTLRFDINFPFADLNPTEVWHSGASFIFPLLYSFLFVPNSKGDLEPDLALKWIYDPKKFTWTIHLRDNAFFHDGRPVRSEDVLNSLNMGFKNLKSELLPLINHIFSMPDNILCICLKEDDPEFVYKICDMSIIPKSREIGIDYYHHPVGSGPFKFLSRKADNQVVLEANKAYYNTPPSLDRIVFYYQPDKENSWTRLLAGLTDIAYEISPINLEMMSYYKNCFYIKDYLDDYYALLLYNMLDPLFSDVRVRTALTYAIDREYIVRTILKGHCKVAAGPMGAESPYHNPEVKPLPYNPQTGLKLLHEAGWSFNPGGRYLQKNGMPFEFTILVLKECKVEKKVARYIQICLNEVGIKAHLKFVSFKNFPLEFGNNHNFQCVLTEFVSANRNPEFMVYLWALSSLPSKPVSAYFDDLIVTRLINKAIKEKNPSIKKKYFYQIDSLITSLQPATFLYDKVSIDIMSKRIVMPTPFSLELEGIYRLRHASIRTDSIDDDCILK